MMLCLDIGNSQIFGGVFVDGVLQLRFRHTTATSSTSDQLGIFLKIVLRENGFAADTVQQIAVCSVVPSLEYSLRAACIKYFTTDPFFLQPGSETDLQIHYYNPHELGADRLANAIAATHYFPDRNIVIIDFGTATTFCAINKHKQYLGGAILPGMKLSMNALQTGTARLFAVEIIKPQHILGRSTAENLQSGLYYGQLGVLREFTQHIQQTHFSEEPPVIIGTGGFSYLFEEEGIFTAVMPDLVLQGLRLAVTRNQKRQK